MSKETCERDCDYNCYGCERNYCDIKKEENLKHEDELPEAIRTVEGNHYCNYDCFRDQH